MNQTLLEEEIPRSYTSSVDRPFEPVGIRWNHEQEQLNRRPAEERRLTDEEVQELIRNPTIKPGGERIKKLTKEANEKREKEFEDVKIYNLSMKEIGERTTTTVHKVLDDMLMYDPADGMAGFLHIFTKEDRLMYMGILMIAFTIIIMLIKTSD